MTEIATIDRQIICTYTNALRDFGYIVSEKWVRREVNALMKGERPSSRGSGSYMSRFIAGWLVKHGLMEAVLFGSIILYWQSALLRSVGDVFVAQLRETERA